MSEVEDPSVDDQSDGTPEPVEAEASGPIEASSTEEELEGAAPETVNLVGTIDLDEQKRIADTVFEDYERDWRSSEKYRQKRADILKLYLGELPPKEEGYAQIHYALIAKAIQRLHARVYDQQFPSNGEYFGARPTSASDLDRSVRVGKHMNWQILHQIPEYVPNHDSLIMQWYLYGSAFSYMYWDPGRNRPCHEACVTEDIVLPYTRRSTDPSLSDVPRITRIVRKYRFGEEGLDALAKTGYYDAVNVESVFDGDTENSGQNDERSTEPVQQTIDRAAGVQQPESEKDGPRVLLEQHRWWKLKAVDKEGNSTGWDRYRPVIVTIDRETRTLLSFMLREDEDPNDRARYNREKAANDAAHAAAMQQYEHDQKIYYAGMTANATGIPQPGPVVPVPPPIPGAPPMMVPQPVPPGAVPPDAPPPVAPVAPELPIPPKMVPINFFTHFVCIPNPEGIYGFGIGYLLEGNNLAADGIASAMVTSGALSNVPTGIRSREIKIRGGEFKVRPGEVVEVDVGPQDLDKAIHLFKFPGPEPQLAQFVKDQKEEAEELSGASDILSGEVGGSNETATTTQIRISQALAAISIQNKRYTRARTEEGKKLARLNSVYLSDDDYFPVIDPFHTQPPSDEHIGRGDYLEDVSITVTADPRMASQPQRLQEAIQAVNTFAQIAGIVPALQQNVALWNALGVNVAKAMDRPDIVAAMTAQPIPPPMPPPPPGALPPHTAPAPSKAVPPAGQNGGPPRPHPAPPGPNVPNGGPNAPANAPFAGQGQ